MAAETDSKRDIEVRLSRLIRFGTPEERESAIAELVRENMKLSPFFAKRCVNQGVEFEDLVQEGYCGLLRAAESYDSDRGRFASYARYWITRSMYRAIQNQGRSIRLPAHRQETLNRVKRAIEELTRQNGDIPNNEEVAAYLGMYPEEVEELLQIDNPIASLDASIGDGTTSYGQLIPDDSVTIQEQLESEEQKKKLNEALSQLNDRERLIVKLKFGLTPDHKQYSLNEISETIGLSRERVRQISMVACTKLRDMMDAEYDDE